jgi:hypothetical protein
MTKHDAESLAAEQRASSKLELHYEGTTEAFGRGNSRFSIFEVGEGCACSMLTDNADWNAATWEFQPMLLCDLASTFAFISERAPNGFAVEAVWIGDRVKESLEVSLDEFLEVVRRNTVATKAKYIVSAA